MRGEAAGLGSHVLNTGAWSGIDDRFARRLLGSSISREGALFWPVTHDYPNWNPNHKLQDTKRREGAGFIMLYVGLLMLFMISYVT